jgi:hypothetical protein
VILVVAALLGAVGTSRLAVAGRGLGSGLDAPGLWFSDSPARLLLPGPGVGPALAGPFTSLALWAAGWLVAGVAVRRGASLRALLVVGIVWTVPLVLGPPLFSPDVYAYTAIGASIQHGIDPYLSGPGAAGDIPAVRGAEPFWRDSPTPYGPPFLALLSGLSRLLDEDLLSVVVALRVLALVATGVLVWCVARLAPRWGVAPTAAVWLGVLNPLVLVHAVSAGHNDVVMLALALPGLVLASTGRPMWGAVLCGAAAGVKVTAFIAVLVIGVDLALRVAGWWPRLRSLAGVGLAGAGTFAALSQLSGYGWGWLANLSVPGKAVGPVTPTSALALVLDGDDPPLHAVRSAAAAVGVLLGLLVLTRLPRLGLVRVTGWLMLIAVLAGPVVWPWYLMAPVVVLAAAARPRERRLLLVVSLVLLFALLPGGQPTLPLLGRPLAEWLALSALITLLTWYGAVHLVATRRALGAVGRRWTEDPACAS